MKKTTKIRCRLFYINGFGVIDEKSMLIAFQMGKKKD